MPAAVYKIAEPEKLPMTAAEKSVLKVLAYFDIFNYPLTKEEIQQFLAKEMNNSLLERTLKELLASNIIFPYNGFYLLQDNPMPGYRRIRGNKRAAEILPRAKKIGRFLYKFPYVKAIAISGSLSKNFAGEKDDIDFFIITAANRLWIARTFMHLFKKLTFLTGKQHLYCMNYYLDGEALLLEDQNIFTAIEVKTLLPVSGARTMMDFFESNRWSDQWLPACAFRSPDRKDSGESRVKRIGEWIFNNKTGDWFDNFLMRISHQRWERKKQKGKQNDKGQVMGLVTGKHFARSNPGNFQEKVLALYKTKLELLKISESEEDS